MVEPVNDNILNLVNELYNNLDAKDKIINEQALEIARLKEAIYKALKMVSNEKYLHIERLEKIKDILGDKENECKRNV